MKQVYFYINLVFVFSSRQGVKNRRKLMQVAIGGVKNRFCGRSPNVDLAAANRRPGEILWLPGVHLFTTRC